MTYHKHRFECHECELLEAVRDIASFLRKQTEIAAQQAGDIHHLAGSVHKIAHELHVIRGILTPHRTLSRISLVFGGTMSQGPVTLTPATPRTKATVLGFNADGSPFTGTMPTATYTPDSTSFASFTDDGTNGSDIVGSADGTTNLGVTLTTAEGVPLSDSSQVITSGFSGTTQVLASIKLDFSTPTA